jgi:hypothetical protein
MRQSVRVRLAPLSPPHPRVGRRWALSNDLLTISGAVQQTGTVRTHALAFMLILSKSLEPAVKGGTGVATSKRRREAIRYGASHMRAQEFTWETHADKLVDALFTRRDSQV